MTDPQNGAAVAKVPPKSKGRSPNYPAIPLSECVGQVLKLYNAERRTAVSSDSAARALGYGSLSGAPRTIIAALRQFGLVENIGDNLRVSDLAMELLHNPAGSPERSAALRAAATKPPLVNELMATHAEASAESLRAYLITKRKFAPDGAGRFVETFRDALKYITGESPTDDPGEDGEAAPVLTKDESRLGKTPQTPERGKGNNIMQFAWPLSGDVIASLTVSGDFDADDLDTLDTYLQGAKKAMTKAAKARSAQTASAATTQPTEPPNNESPKTA